MAVSKFIPRLKNSRVSTHFITSLFQPCRDSESISFLLPSSYTEWKELDDGKKDVGRWYYLLKPSLLKENPNIRSLPTLIVLDGDEDVSFHFVILLDNFAIIS